MSWFNDLQQMGTFSSLDLHFARLMTRLAGGDLPELGLAAALASRFRGRGHSCLALATVAGTVLDQEDLSAAKVFCPELDLWRSLLVQTTVVGAPGDFTPLVLDRADRLYLYRYWEYEQVLANAIKQRHQTLALAPDQLARIKDTTRRLFPVKAGDMDWQRLAALVSVLKPFTVISGGPGTGKTYTVAKILTILLASDPGLRIALAAPTGKAAARLQEALQLEKAKLHDFPAAMQAIPDESFTIHRLLGSRRGSSSFRHNAENTLPFDVVIIDEASMVDLALMAKLVVAVPRQARLILLGDQDQLASVEAGAVLGDICSAGQGEGFSREFGGMLAELCGADVPIAEEQGRLAGAGALGDCIVSLRQSHRFTKKSGIGRLAGAVNSGDVVLAMKIMNAGVDADIGHKPLPEAAKMATALRNLVVAGFRAYLEAATPAAAFAAFARFRLLCALRRGPFGVDGLNKTVELILAEAGFIRPDSPWYHGRPVMVASNDYTLQLFNGDVGLTLADDEPGAPLRVYFPGPDGAGVRGFLPGRLPETRTVYAMTVHKSQGSEFESVLMVLPDRDTPVLTRELIYTGITRARDRIELWCQDDIFKQAVARVAERGSGLRDLLHATES